MSEIIERVAKAMEAKCNRSHDWEFWLDEARAAIAAMREPTENMFFVGSNEDAGYSASDLRISWQLMIGAALK